MLLGGLRYIVPIIESAHSQGYHVITVDNVPDNYAHRHSDEYVNVSIVDKEAVLKVAQELNIDGIMSFACDPGVVTASYVQNLLGLPSFGPFDSVVILQNKDKFRSFLSEHGFNVPFSKGFASMASAMREACDFPFPVIVKPTDSAGSKGCTKVERKEDIRPAIERAMSFSHSGHIISEKKKKKKGFSSDSDCMSIDGKLVFSNFSAQRFDPDSSNPFVPASYSWPSTFSADQKQFLESEIQRLITLLNLKTAVFNIETLIGTNDKPYIMELTPRGGGNRLSEIVKYITGVDLITAITRFSVGDSIPDSFYQKTSTGYWAEIILHSNKCGVFNRLDLAPNIPAKIVDCDLWLKKGDRVDSFLGANAAIGTLIMQFYCENDMEFFLANQDNWLKVIIE